ncbi:hypothetical protein BDY19DRAFT_887972, partial [Irpex rosettiformis]
ALSIYDYCLTRVQERKLIWQREILIASLLFLASRYIVILENMSLVVQIARGIYGNTQSIDSVIFAATRTYALWGNDLRVFSFVLALGLVNPICTVVRISFCSQ